MAFGNGNSGKIVGIGKIGKSLSHSIDNVYLADGLQHNLLSISQLCYRGNYVEFSSNQCSITNVKSGDVVLRGKRYNLCIKLVFSHFLIIM